MLSSWPAVTNVAGLIPASVLIFFFVSSLKDVSLILPENNNFVSPPVRLMDFRLTIKLNVQRYIILGMILKQIIVES